MDGTTPAAPKAGRRLVIPLPPAWLVFNLVVIVMAAGLVYGDRQYWHWYVPRDAVTEQRAHLDDVDSRLVSLSSDVSAAERTAAKAQQASPTYAIVDTPERSLARISSALAIVSLVQSKGGFQSSGSAQGKACINWLLKGEGSVTDCGFSRTD